MKTIFGLVLLLGCVVATAHATEPLFSALSNEKAWEALPKLKEGSRESPLPAWARVLARSLPATTAAMLEMDYAYRDDNPLDPQLRAKIRWVVAHVNGSRYGMACAEADLVRAGGSATLLKEIAKGSNQIPEKEAAVFDFVQKLATTAYEITDEEVSDLLSDWGPEQVTAMVLTVAYSGFQDRILIVTGVDPESEQWDAPPKVKFDWDDVKKNPPKAAPRVEPEKVAGTVSLDVQPKGPKWESAAFEELRKRLGQQQLRGPRIPIPPDEVVEQKTPPGIYPPGQASKIRWNSVTYGYQPELTHAWFFTMRRFREDSQLPDDFRQSVFWVVTRSNMCFY